MSLQRQRLSDTTILLIEAERNQLWQLEAVRGDARRRETTWKAGLWQTTLNRMIGYESTRYANYQHLIEATPAGSTEQRSIELGLDSAIAADIKWHEILEHRQRAMIEQWLANGRARTPELTELAEHHHQIAEHLVSLRVLREQVALECLERRRRCEGGLAPGAWGSSLATLREALHRQDLFYQHITSAKATVGASGDERAALRARQERARSTLVDLTARRLDWYRRLREMQQASRQSIPGDQRTRRAALDADARLLDAEIRRLGPRSSSRIVWTVALLLIVLAALVCLLVLQSVL